jgi:hypothetical protein
MNNNNTDVDNNQIEDQFIRVYPLHIRYVGIVHEHRVAKPVDFVGKDGPLCILERNKARIPYGAPDAFARGEILGREVPQTEVSEHGRDSLKRGARKHVRRDVVAQSAGIIAGPKPAPRQTLIRNRNQNENEEANFEIPSLYDSFCCII